MGQQALIIFLTKKRPGPTENVTGQVRQKIIDCEQECLVCVSGPVLKANARWTGRLRQAFDIYSSLFPPRESKASQNGIRQMWILSSLWAAHNEMEIWCACRNSHIIGYVNWCNARQPEEPDSTHKTAPKWDPVTTKHRWSELWTSTDASVCQDGRSWSGNDGLISTRSRAAQLPTCLYPGEPTFKFDASQTRQRRLLYHFDQSGSHASQQPVPCRNLSCVTRHRKSCQSHPYHCRLPGPSTPPFSRTIAARPLVVPISKNGV